MPLLRLTQWQCSERFNSQHLASWNLSVSSALHPATTHAHSCKRDSPIQEWKWAISTKTRSQAAVWAAVRYFLRAPFDSSIYKALCWPSCFLKLHFRCRQDQTRKTSPSNFGRWRGPRRWVLAWWPALFRFPWRRDLLEDLYEQRHQRSNGHNAVGTSTSHVTARRSEEASNGRQAWKNSFPKTSVLIPDKNREKNKRNELLRHLLEELRKETLSCAARPWVGSLDVIANADEYFDQGELPPSSGKSRRGILQRHREVSDLLSHRFRTHKKATTFVCQPCGSPPCLIEVVQQTSKRNSMALRI